MPNCFSLWDHIWSYDYQPIESCWPDDCGNNSCVSYNFNTEGLEGGQLYDKIILIFMSASW